MRDADRVRLLGTYKAPPLKPGDRTDCLYRDTEVIIKGWSNARIPCPQCTRARGRGPGFGLLVDEELVRAVRHESAAALDLWWACVGAPSSNGARPSAWGGPTPRVAGGSS